MTCSFCFSYDTSSSSSFSRLPERGVEKVAQVLRILNFSVAKMRLSYFELCEKCILNQALLSGRMDSRNFLINEKKKQFQEMTSKCTANYIINSRASKSNLCVCNNATRHMAYRQPQRTNVVGKDDH